jgi:hypothetical protein
LEHSGGVCQSFIEGLDDTWLVIPRADLGEQPTARSMSCSLSPAGCDRDRSEGARHDQQGKWFSNGHPLKQPPTEQITKAGTPSCIACGRRT